MILHAPIEITARLLPGIKVGDAYLSICYADRPGNEGRTRYRYFIDLPNGVEYENDDLQSGCDGGNLAAGLSELLFFLAACGESMECRPGEEPGENADLFPSSVAKWCAENSDELSALSAELEETETVLIEE